MAGESGGWILIWSPWTASRSSQARRARRLPRSKGWIQTQSSQRSPSTTLMPAEPAATGNVAVTRCASKRTTSVSAPFAAPVLGLYGERDEAVTPEEVHAAR